MTADDRPKEQIIYEALQVARDGFTIAENQLRLLDRDELATPDIYALMVQTTAIKSHCEILLQTVHNTEGMNLIAEIMKAKLDSAPNQGELFPYSPSDPDYS